MIDQLVEVRKIVGFSVCLEAVFASFCGVVTAFELCLRE